MTFPLFASGVLLGLLVGILIGVRAKQLLAALHAISSAAKAAASQLRTAQARGSGSGSAGALREEEDCSEAKAKVGIDAFIHAASADTALSEHPDIHISPVILWQIQKSKEKTREAIKRCAPIECRSRTPALAHSARPERASRTVHGCPTYAKGIALLCTLALSIHCTHCTR